MKKLKASAFIFVLFTGVGMARADHHCAKDALARSAPLLRLQYADSSEETVQNLFIDGKVSVGAPIKTPVGKGSLDVLETTGYVYRSKFHMRFIYAKFAGSCALMGQEILEISNPYKP